MMLRPLIALTLVAAAIAGCGGTPAGKTAEQTTTQQQDKALTFSACMRSNGVKDFPDPDASGELTIDGVLNGSDLDPDDPAWKQALKACEDLKPSGFTGRKRTAEEQEPALAFAQCIRDHGVKDFPDPTPDSPLIDTNRIPSSNQPGGMDVLNAAIAKCKDAGDKAIGDR